MAYAAVVSLAQTIDRTRQHDQYDPISLPANQEIVSIRDHATALQEFLDGFPEKATVFEERITEVAYKAEDIIEYLMLEKIGSSHCGSTNSTVVGVSKVKLKRQLRKTAEKMKSIVEEVTEIKKSVEITKDVQPSDFPAASAATSSSRLAPIGENDMVGFDDDLESVKEWLCGESSGLQILSIVGTGGIGKTTLARNVYHDPLIKESFTICAWVTISQDYDIKEILSALLVSLKHLIGEEISEQSTELMGTKVYQTLKCRKYLIVVDDMWSTKTWDDVKMLFPDDDNGSRIVLTTRLTDVAEYASNHLHEIELMDLNQSWYLLREKVFKQDQCFDDKLENIGRNIAERCSGLPLAIVVVAGLLSNVNQTVEAWQEIADNMDLAITENDENIAAVLSLSYTHLPYRLRACFMYMAGFPEDYEIRISKLIKLWIAEGFLKSSASKSYEEAAEECLEDLVKRNLVLVTKRKSNGKIKSCSVHDLLRDLCLMKSLEEKFLLYFTGRFVLQEIFQNQRRISIGYSDCLAHINTSTIRTIICYQHSQSSIASFKKFRLLRILDMVKDKSYVNQLPARVFELLRLRYLALNSTIDISATILNLQNLQTLIIHPDKQPNMGSLPVEIWRLPQLRHLIVFSSQSLPHPEEATSPLQNLQTLSLVADFICSERILKMIPKLRKLGICYSEAKSDEDYHLDNLQHLLQLEKLKFEIGRDFPMGYNLNPIFPASLKKLTLSGCRLPWENMSIVGSLPELEVLKLRDLAFQGDEWETTEEEFGRLKFLLIDNSDLQCWVTESSHFPGLKCLSLRRCPKLSEIPNEIGEISALEMIEVDNRSLLLSAKQIQKEQEEEYDHQIHIHMLSN